MAGTGSLRILHVASHQGVFRGGAVQLGRMALEQKRRGHDVTVVANRCYKKVKPAEIPLAVSSWNFLKDAGIPVHFINLQSWLGRWQLRRLVQARPFDILHAHRDEALVGAWWALSGLPRPALIAQRGTIATPPPEARRAFASPRVRAVINVADSVRQSLVQAVGPSLAAKARVVYGSVDLDTFSPRPPRTELKRQAGCPDDALVIGSLSAYRLAKAFDILLEALVPVFQAHPRARCVLLGKGVQSHMRPLAHELEIDTRCHFLGHQTNVADWLTIMDLTVMSADGREGLSGVLRESLAMEVPVISTDCAGNREIVRDRETGLLVPMRDVEALSRAFLWAIEHREEMRAMAQRGRRWVEENCSLTRQGDHLLEIYRSALR